MRQVEQTINKGKKSLETLLKEKAIKDVSQELLDQGIDPNEVDDEDFEVLVAEKAHELESNLKAMGIGGALGFATSLFIGL
jgi:hypothetical protein